MSDWERAELEAQRDLAVKLARKGIPIAAIVARVACLGPERRTNTVSKWIGRAEPWAS